jgi:hypothetical protein
MWLAWQKIEVFTGLIKYYSKNLSHRKQDTDIMLKNGDWESAVFG